MKIISVLKKLARDSTAEIYYVGEYARNILRHKKSNNIEILIRNLQFNVTLKYLRKHLGNGYKIRIPSRYKCEMTIEVGNVEVIIVSPKKNGVSNPFYTIEDDSIERIFPLDSIYIPILSRNKKDVIDIYGGMEDIKHKRIRIIGKPNILIKRDPSIIFMTLSLAAKLGYHIDNNLFYAMRANYKLVDEVSIDIVRDSLVDMLLSKKPSRYFSVMNDLGILSEIIPELSMCSGLSQNAKYHKYDVFEHCIVACDNTDPNLTLRIAALFHDIGKAQAREEIKENGDTHVTFYNHEVLGSKISKKILRRLKFNRDIVKEVSFLVYNHMYNYEPNRWTDAAVRRFIKKVGIEEKDLESLDTFPLFLLRKADRAANGLGLSEISPRQRAFQKRIKKVYEKANALKVTDLDIDGSIIMEKFNLKPGPTVGHVLNYLLSMVIEDQKMNKKELLIEEASKYLSEALK